MAAAAFEELKALPKDEQHSQVQGLNAEQLRELVHYLGHPKAGTRVDNIPKVLAALEDGGPNSPVGRDGRGRSPKLGRSAYALRSSAASQNEIAAKGVDKTRSPTVEEFIGSGGPNPSAPIPAIQPLPGFMAAVDAAGAGANVVIQTVPGAEIDAAQAQAHAEMAVDESEASDASAVSDAPEVTGEVSTNDLMRKLNTMEKQRKADKAQIQKKIMAQTKVMISEAVDPLKDGLAEVQSNITQLGQSAVILDNRVGTLESKFDKLHPGAPRNDKGDLGHLRVAFKGFKTESLDERFEVLKAFVEKHLGTNYVCIDTRMKGEYQNRVASDESFVQFATPDARDRALTKLKDRKCTSSKGVELKISKSKTEWQRHRDWAIRKAEEMIKEKMRSKNMHEQVKYTATKESRKLTVKNTVAFLQLRDDVAGRFQSGFADLKLP